jgi:hypothetical protein
MALATSDPSLPLCYFDDRDAGLIRLYPPSLDAGTLKVQAMRKLADSTDIAATLDLEPLWGTYVQYELAARLAGAKSQFQRVPALKATAEEHLNRARGAAHEYAGDQLILNHTVRI